MQTKNEEPFGMQQMFQAMCGLVQHAGSPGTLSLLCPTQQEKRPLFTTKPDSSNKLEPLIPQNYHILCDSPIK